MTLNSFTTASVNKLYLRPSAIFIMWILLIVHLNYH